MTASPEMSPVVEGLREVVHGLGDIDDDVVGRITIDRFAELTGFVVEGRGRPTVVLGPQVGVELGHPKTSSRVVIATTSTTGLVEDGRITRIGPDLDTLVGTPFVPFGQALLLEVRPDSGPDPFELENTMLLTNRLPGYMVRSVPGRLWVRIDRDAIAGGMSFKTIATALWCAYHKGFDEVTAVETVFVTRSIDAVEALAPLALEAKARSGEHKKLVLNADGELECAEESCDICDERNVCDAAREILRSRRTRRAS